MMTYAEFEFWKSCVVRFASADVSAADAGREADKLVSEYRKRAAQVVDYHGDGLFMTKDGPSGSELASTPKDLRDGTWKPATFLEEQGH